MSRPAPKPGLISRLAPVAADAFYEISELPDRWETLPEFKRQTFRRIAAEAVTVAKWSRGLGLDPRTQIAAAASRMFLDPRDCPAWLVRKFCWHSGTDRDASRPIWLHIADAIIAEGQRLRALQNERTAA